MHFRYDLRRILSEIFLIDAALLINNKSHHAGYSIFRRPGNEAEAENHIRVNNVIELAARRVTALAFQNFEQVAVKRLRSIIAGGRIGEVTLSLRFGD